MNDRFQKDDDLKLVERCLNGDHGAFETLVDKYQKVIFNLAYRISNDFTDAEDIAQTVFLKVFEKLDSFDKNYKFFSWIYRIAINESLNTVAKRRPTDEINENLHAQEQRADEYLLRKETAGQIQDALMELQPQYRVLIVLKHYANCSYREIGFILDIDEKTVKSRLFTARQLLKNVLLKKGYMKND